MSSRHHFKLPFCSLHRFACQHLLVVLVYLSFSRLLVISGSDRFYDACNCMHILPVFLDEQADVMLSWWKRLERLQCCKLAHSSVDDEKSFARSNFSMWIFFLAHKRQAIPRKRIKWETLRHQLRRNSFALLPFSCEACDMNYFLFEWMLQMCIFMETNGRTDTQSFTWNSAWFSLFRADNQIAIGAEVRETQEGKNKMKKI